MLAPTNPEKTKNYPPGLLSKSETSLKGLKKNNAQAPCCFPGCFSFVHQSWLKQEFENHVVYYGKEHNFSLLLTCTMVAENEPTIITDNESSPRESVLSCARTEDGSELFSEKVAPPYPSSVDSSRTMSPMAPPLPPVIMPTPMPTPTPTPPPPLPPMPPQIQIQQPQPHQLGFYHYPPLQPTAHFIQPPVPEYAFNYISESKKLLVQRIESGLHSGRFLATVQFSSNPNNECPGFLVYIPVCWFHLNSSCHFGSKCKHVHERRKNWKLATWSDIEWFLAASSAQIKELDDDFKHQSAIKRTIDH